VAQKQADLAAAQATAAVATLRAPFSGVVTHRAQNPGDLADPSTPILEISETHSLNLLANLPAEDGLKVRQGMAAHVEVADLPGQTFAGRVLSVGQVDPQTNLLAVRIAVANPQAKLKSGTFATASIVLRRDPNAIVVPKQALVTTEDKPTLFVVGADNVAHKQNVTIGAETNTDVEILSGVKAGAQFIKLGQYELSDGAKVQTADKADKGDSKAETQADEKKGDKADSKAEPATDKSGEKPAKADEKAKDTAP
jgi:RND family efflux transporter MFP subunit